LNTFFLFQFKSHKNIYWCSPSYFHRFELYCSLCILSCGWRRTSIITSTTII